MSFYLLFDISNPVLLKTAKEDKGPQVDVLTTAKNDKGP